MATRWGEVKLCQRTVEHTEQVAASLKLDNLFDIDGMGHLFDMALNDIEAHMMGAPHTGGTVSLNEVLGKLGL